MAHSILASVILLYQSPWMNTVLVIMYGDYANSVMRRQVQLNPSSFCSVALLCDHTECSLRWHRAHTLRV